MAEKAHSILGASSCHRWLNCPGSVRLSVGIPKTSSTYADEGTAAHELAETCLRSGADAVKYVGKFITVNETAYEVTPDMAAAVQVYLDTVRADLAAAGDGAELEIEKRFHLDWLYDGMFGTNDALVGQPFGLLRIYDYKHGMGVAVDVQDNPQLMYYALGAAHGETYDEVELIIVQPRAQHPSGPVRRQRMWVAELDRWANEVLLPGAEATEANGASVRCGEWCKFCPAMAICPAQRENAVAIAQEVFRDKPAPPPAPESLGAGELRRVLDVAPMVEAWLEACRAHARVMLEHGHATPDELGYKLVEGRSMRKWVSDEEALATMEMFSIDPYERKLKSPAQAEKQAKKGAFDSVITTTRGIQLAPLSDKRPAITGAIPFEEVNI